MTEDRERQPTQGLLRWSAWIYLALAVAAVVWLGLRDGTIPLALFFSREGWLPDLGLGVAAAALLMGLWQLGVTFLPSAKKLERVVAETIGPLGFAEVFTLAVLSGFAEELFFRGAVQSQWGLVPATALFALLHLGPGREFRLWTAFALVAGTVLGGLMLWRGTLVAPVTAHAVVNLVGLSRLQRISPVPVQEPS